MLRSTLLRFSICSLVLCAGIMSCTLDDGPSVTHEAPLTLSYTQEYSLTTLSWDKVKVTGFKEYILLQSINPIPDSPEPEVSAEVTVLKRINEVDVTSLSVSPSLLSPVICYTLYCAVDDRFLYSSNICIEQQFFLTSGFYDRACHADGEDEFVMFDRLNNKLSSLNYQTGEVTNTVNDIVLNFPTLEMVKGGDNTVVYGSEQSPPWLRRYTLPSLSATHSKAYSDILWAANAHGNFVFIGTAEFNKNFQVLRADNLNVITSRSGIFSNQMMAVFGEDPITVITLGTSESRKYTINSAGMIEHEEFLPPRIAQTDVQHNCGQGKEIFICGILGQIINANGDLVGQLNNDFNAAILLTRISPEDEYAAVVINTGGNQVLRIYDLSALPNISILQDFIVPSGNYGDIVFDQHTIRLIGGSFTPLDFQTVIFQFPLQP